MRPHTNEWNGQRRIVGTGVGWMRGEAPCGRPSSLPLMCDDTCGRSSSFGVSPYLTGMIPCGRPSSFTVKQHFWVFSRDCSLWASVLAPTVKRHFWVFSRDDPLWASILFHGQTTFLGIPTRTHGQVRGDTQQLNKNLRQTRRKKLQTPFCGML
jgi:hypothetical protein